HAGQKTEGEQRGTQHAKEKHGLPAEAKLKPYGHEIEHTDGDSSPGELGDACLSRVQWNRLRSEPEPGGGGDDDHEAMPIRAQRHVSDHLAPVRLHRVEIGYRDAKQRATQPIIDSGDERLVVLALLGTGDDVGPALENRSYQPGNVVRKVLQVRWVEDED